MQNTKSKKLNNLFTNKHLLMLLTIDFVGAWTPELGMACVTKAQHKEGPTQLRLITVRLAHIAKARHRGDGISSLTKWASPR